MDLKEKLKKNKIIHEVVLLIRLMKRNFLYHLPKKFLHKRLFYKVLHKKLNLKNPKDFNEKIQYFILNKYGKIEAKLSDKYLVREYVKERGLEDILVKLYKKYDDVEQIDLDELPERFVLKANNGCGNVFICRDKKQFNLEECKKKLKKALKTNFAKENFEYHYKYIKPCVICEQYLDDKKNISPVDYKFFCFDGQPDCVLTCSDRDNNLKLDYYDLNWNNLNYVKKEYKSEKLLERPNNLEEMIEVAKVLSKGHKFVRVDLYDVNGKIYFGEMTFTPSAGTMYKNTQESLDHLGSLLKI